MGGGRSNGEEKAVDGRPRKGLVSPLSQELDFVASPADGLWVRVYYEDTDFSGRAYHASYLRFLERGRTEWLRRRGFAHGDLAETSGVVFVVRSLQIEFLAPAMMDDLLIVETNVAAVGEPRSRFSNARCAATRNS